MTDELRSRLIEIIENVAPDADLSSIDDDQNFREYFGLDSMDLLTIVEDIAEETGVEIPESDYDDVLTLQSLVAYVHQAAPSAPQNARRQ